MIQTVKKWLSKGNPQFSLHTTLDDNNTVEIGVYLFKCKQVVYLGESYNASWHRGIRVRFLRAFDDMIHLYYELVDSKGEFLDDGVVNADGIYFDRGKFVIKRKNIDDDN